MSGQNNQKIDQIFGSDTLPGKILDLGLFK